MSNVVLLRKLFNIQKGLNEPLDRDGEGIGYKFLSSDKVVDAIKPLLDKEGVMCNTRVISYEVKEHNQMLGTRPILENTFILNLEFVFTDIDTGAEHTVNYAGAGNIGLAKGMASAITSTKKTFYIDFFNIRVKDVEDVEVREIDDLESKIKECKNVQDLQILYNSFTKEQKNATAAIREAKIDEFKEDAKKKDAEIKDQTKKQIEDIKAKKEAVKATAAKKTTTARRGRPATKTTTKTDK